MFRVLIMFGAAAAIVIAVALLIGSLAGAIVGAIFIVIGLWRTWQLIQEWRRYGSELAVRVPVNARRRIRAVVVGPTAPADDPDSLGKLAVLMFELVKRVGALVAVHVEQRTDPTHVRCGSPLRRRATAPTTPRCAPGRWSHP